MIMHAQITSPIGMIYLAASENGLTQVSLHRCDHSLTASSGEKQVKYLAHAARELEEYFAGQRTEFTVPLDLKGTEFQRTVWTALTKIPYGDTWSYARLAHTIGNAKAVRAVGGANGKNRHWIIVPCHRVIASDGSLGGYAGGLEIKRHLLEHENRLS